LYVQHPSYSPSFYIPQSAHEAHPGIQQNITGKASASQLAGSPPGNTSKQPNTAFSATTQSTPEYNKGSNNDYNKYGQQSQYASSARESSYYNVSGQQQYTQPFLPQPFLGSMIIPPQQHQQQGTPSPAYHSAPTQQATTLAPPASSQGRNSAF
jgi:hypothetical protein